MWTGKWQVNSRRGSRRTWRKPGSMFSRSAARSNCRWATSHGLIAAATCSVVMKKETSVSGGALAPPRRLGRLPDDPTGRGGGGETTFDVVLPARRRATHAPPSISRETLWSPARWYRSARLPQPWRNLRSRRAARDGLHWRTWELSERRFRTTRSTVGIVLIAVALAMSGCIGGPPHTPGPTRDPASSACGRAFVAAAAADGDDLSDLYPVVRACRSPGEWIEFFVATEGGGFSGSPEAVLTEVCREPAVAAEPLCVAAR